MDRRHRNGRIRVIDVDFFSLPNQRDTLELKLRFDKKFVSPTLAQKQYSLKFSFTGVRSADIYAISNHQKSPMPSFK